MPDQFDPDALMRAADAQIPEADFGPTGFEEALQILLSTLRDEARLNQAGTWVAVSRCAQSLVRRRMLSRLLRMRPEIHEVDIAAPIVIVGFPRSGTTALHNMLAANPRHRAIRTWEMREPFAPPDAASDAAKDWAAKAEKSTQEAIEAQHRRSPALMDIHPLNATWPYECAWLLRNSFASLSDALVNFIPTYARWIMNRDISADYAYYRQQLQAILCQRPGAPLILKDPCHTWHLPALLKALPDARIVHVHRDIREVASSFASLCRTLQQSTSEPRPHEEVGAFYTEMLENGMKHMLAARQRLAPERFLDLSYRQFVADPVGTIAAIHDHWDLAWTPEASDATTAWLAQSKKRSGQHRHDLATFGLDAEDLRERFAPYFMAFAEYL